MRCPCCTVQLKAPEMFRHVWQDHHLLLDGAKARPPWELVAQWAREYRQGKNPSALARCLALAKHLDPRWGETRLDCLAQIASDATGEALGTLLVEAATARVSVCPQCYGFVPTPLDQEPYGISFSHGRLSAHGYKVEIAERGLFPRLSVETPREVIFHEIEPGRWLTYRGGLLLLAAPLVALTLLVACGLPDLGVPLIVPVLGLFLLVAVILWVLRFRDRRLTESNTRALTYAWTILAPQLHKGEFSAEDSSFVAGLALTTVHEGAFFPEKEILQRLITLTEDAAIQGKGVMRHVGALWRLAIHQRVMTGLDLGQMIAGQAQRCFEGPLSLEFVEGLLSGWEPRDWERQKARVRMLVCERAFEAGFEVLDLLKAGETAPSLERLVGRNAAALAQLRLLWSLRPRRPWDRFGSALTVFEIAEQTDSAETLAKYPDLLLLGEMPGLPSVSANGERAAHAAAALCAAGVYFQETLFSEFPRSFEVVRKSGAHGRHELIVGESRFRFSADPEAVASQLERWMRFFFGEFRSQVQEVGTWRSPDAAAVLRARGSVTCPDCHSDILPRPGELGLALDAYEKARSLLKQSKTSTAS
jgi:hypothetical protein